MGIWSQTITQKVSRSSLSCLEREPFQDLPVGHVAEVDVLEGYAASVSIHQIRCTICIFHLERERSICTEGRMGSVDRDTPHRFIQELS